MTDTNKIKVLAWAVIQLAKEVAFTNSDHDEILINIIENIHDAMEQPE